MDAQAVLAAAAAMIEEGGLCQGADARTADGAAVFPHDRRARSWSITGALLVAGREASGTVFIESLHALAVALGEAKLSPLPIRWDHAPGLARRWSERVWKWEDAPGRTVEHVLRTFDRAKEGVS